MWRDIFLILGEFLVQAFAIYQLLIKLAIKQIGERLQI